MQSKQGMDITRPIGISYIENCFTDIPYGRSVEPIQIFKSFDKCISVSCKTVFFTCQYERPDKFSLTIAFIK